MVINSPEKDQVEFEFDLAAATENETLLSKWSGKISDFGSGKETKTMLMFNDTKDKVDSNGLAPEDVGSKDAIKIIVIDDDPDDRLQVRRSIEAHNLLGVFKIHEFEDPRKLDDAVLQSAQVFLVDLDLGPVGVDGYQVIERIRRTRGKSVRIFSCSNRSSMQSTTDSAKFGADAFISKPFDVEKLLKLCIGLNYQTALSIERSDSEPNY